MINIEIHNDIGYSPVPRKKINSVVESILKENRINEAEIGIILLDNKKIKKINKEFLNHNYETDVISFLLEESPFEGEIYISVEQAKAQAKQYNVSLMNEVLRLVSHGMLHLVGYDDDTVDNKNEMHRLENLYLNKLAKKL